MLGQTNSDVFRFGPVYDGLLDWLKMAHSVIDEEKLQSRVG